MKKLNEELRADHELVRNKVATFDFTMSTIEITGKDVRAFLNELCVNNVGAVAAGKVMYTSMLDENGLILDDLTLYCFSDDKFWMISAFWDTTAPWMEKNLNGRDVICKDLSDRMKMWPVQGPYSRKALNCYLKDEITDMKYYTFAPNKAGDVDVIISRTGFTGELGYEIFADADDIDKIIADLCKAANDLGIAIIESDVTLESLPTEKGLIQQRDFAETNPLEMGLDFSICWEKDFIGKDALLKIKEAGVARKLVGFETSNDEIDIENESPVFYNGKEVGKVTCANYGYTVEKSIGYVLIDSCAAAYGNAITIKSGDNEISATLCNRVFYDAKRERINA